MAFFGHLATFFCFAALVLQIFTMIGTTYNKPFLHDLYFAKLVMGSDFYIFGLWSYCTGSDSTVTTCSKPVAAFDWSTAEGLSQLDGLHSLDKVFLANFILYWIALGLTFIALVVTVMSHFRRGPDLCATFGTFIAFVVMLAVFVIVLVVSIRGINIAKGVDSSVHGYLGPSTWCTLGAFVALLFASVGYCVACIFGPGRVRSSEKV
jgi:uncharacterized membrane protein YciS (DUF1049 family)